MNLDATLAPKVTPVVLPAPAHSSNGDCSVNGMKVNILLVDDRPDKLLALEATLVGLGQNIVQASSGKEALRHLLQMDFAVILLDVFMPGMDGYETAALIRQRPRSERTPIIFTTSINQSEGQILKGYTLGAVDYVLSPIVPEVLRTKVSVFVELYKNTEQIRQQAEQLRLMEEAEHRRQMAAAVDRLEAETKRNRFFTLALDMLGIGHFVEGRLLQVNPAWREVLGYTDEELKSVHPFEFLHPEDRPMAEEKARTLIDGAAIGYFETRVRHKDSSYRWIGWTAAAFHAEKLVYIFGRDITARKESEDRIQHLNSELQQRVLALTEINKELEAFNYSISHDLRAPLRSMQGFAAALMEECAQQLSREGKDYANRIVNSASFMDRLLHDLLEYSRLTQSELELLPMNPATALERVVASIGQELREKKAELEIQKPLASVMAHPTTLLNILTNLIDNAMKFVKPGLVPKIRIWTEDKNGAVRLWVEDNGIGIAPGHQRQIFGLFQRLHTREKYSGTGVGLAIVRKGAERMGGSVGVESQPGEGSRFWLELPPAPSGSDAVAMEAKSLRADPV
jgi:PAS domain S-box-containing protein